MKKTTIAILALVVLAAACLITYRIYMHDTEVTETPSSTMEKTPAVYESKLTYRDGEIFAFPDFDLTPTGVEETPGPGGAPWTMRKYRFKISNGTESIDMFWSSGTGDIAPEPFAFAGKNFIIEMQKSEKLGALSPSAFVVSKR